MKKEDIMQYNPHILTNEQLINFLNLKKIHPDILNQIYSNEITPKSLSKTQEKQIECIIYSKHIDNLMSDLSKEQIAFKSYPFMNCCYAHLTTSNVIKISSLNSINFITKSAKVFTLINKAKQFMNLDAIDTHSNTTVAFIDTGIAPHLDFLMPYNRIIHFKDIINNRKIPYDDNGHGTFIAGICAGSGTLSQKQFAGITNCNIVMIKALNHLGETNTNTILEAMQYIYEIKNKFNIKVVCMSFGADYSGENDPLQKGALALWNSGITVVAAAGNSGPDPKSIKSPGTSSRIITVGGLDDGRNDGEVKIADFSSRGPINSRFKPDIVAPSVDITSTTNLNSSLYTTMSGTSVATPMIAGICAIILQNNPKFTPDMVKYHLLNLCTPLTYSKNDEGYGYFKID